jgi:H+/Cl- antiporter ClcA
MLYREARTRFIIHYSYFSVLLDADDDVLMKVFMIGVVVICCVVGVAVNPQLLEDISFPAVSLTNTYHLTLISCAVVSIFNLGYFLSNLSKMMREFEERTQVSSIHVHGINGRGEGLRGGADQEHVAPWK